MVDDDPMSLTTLAFVFWIVMVAIQIGVSLLFLEHVKRDNKAEYDRITAGGENLWFAINPLRVGSAYADPVLHELWGLSEPAVGRSKDGYWLRPLAPDRA